MHSQRSPIQELLYGSDGQNIFLRVDLLESVPKDADIELHVTLRRHSGGTHHMSHRHENGELFLISSDLPDNAISVALGNVYEARVSMSALGIRRGEACFTQVTLVRNGLPIAQLPATGDLEVRSAELAAYAG